MGQKEMPVGKLHPHPENPNRGDVNAITESLEQHGQYRSVVVNKDGTILAGHHVWQAAKGLKLKTLRVDMVDADETSARKILLADNRIAELGPGPDMEALLEVLLKIDTLDGTGFDEDYVQMLQEMLAGAPDLDELENEAGGPLGDEDFMSRLLLVVDTPTLAAWKKHRDEFENDTAAMNALLGI